MAISFVQSATGGNAGLTSLAITLGSSPVDGNTLCCMVMTSSATITSITQTGATWVKDESYIGGQETLWRASNVSGAGTVVTLHWTPPQFVEAIIDEFSGLI